MPISLGQGTASRRGTVVFAGDGESGKMALGVQVVGGCYYFGDDEMPVISALRSLEVFGREFDGPPRLTLDERSEVVQFSAFAAVMRGDVELCDSIAREIGVPERVLRATMNRSPTKPAIRTLLLYYMTREDRQKLLGFIAGAKLGDKELLDLQKLGLLSVKLSASPRPS